MPGPTAATIAVNTPMEVSSVLALYQRPLSGPASLKQAPCREPRSLSLSQQTATSARVELVAHGRSFLRLTRARISRELL